MPYPDEIDSFPDVVSFAGLPTGETSPTQTGVLAQLIDAVVALEEAVGVAGAGDTLVVYTTWSLANGVSPIAVDWTGTTISEQVGSSIVLSGGDIVVSVAGRYDAAWDVEFPVLSGSPTFVSAGLVMPGLLGGSQRVTPSTNVYGTVLGSAGTRPMMPADVIGIAATQDSSGACDITARLSIIRIA